MNKISRYKFLSMTGFGALVFTSAPDEILFNKTKNKKPAMYGLIGKITATAGRRNELINILLEGASDMPGCLSYIISKDSENNNVIWITEVWDSKESHRASLTLPSVREAINRGRPLIEEFGTPIETVPVGGLGLTSKKEPREK